MRKWNWIPALALAAAMLTACASEGAPTAGSASPTAGTPGVTATPASETPDGWTLTRCRIVDGAETGKLILAGEGTYNVYTLDVTDMVVTLDGGSSGPSELRDGMWVDVGHTGLILETFPAQFADARTVAGNTEGLDDRFGLCLQVLEDLWAVDPGLNEGITELGVDFSGLTGFSDSEKAAVAYAFGMAHGIMPITGTYEELVEQGYIDGEELLWDDGCLFSITGSLEEGFEAQKWRSGLGAYFYTDCTAKMAKDGAWSYEIGGEAIS